MILRYVFRNLARRKTRTAMGILGVFCTLGLLTAIHVGLESVAVSFVDLVSLQAGKADLTIRREQSEWWRPEAFDPAEVAQKVGKDARVRGLSPRLYGVRPVSAGSEMRFALVVGIDPARERELGIDGFTPAPELGKGVAALSETMAKALGGDTFTIGNATLRKGAVIQQIGRASCRERVYVLV